MLRRLLDPLPVDLRTPLGSFAIAFRADLQRRGAFVLGQTETRDIELDGHVYRAVIERHTNRVPTGAPGVSLFEVVGEPAHAVMAAPASAYAMGIDVSHFQRGADLHASAAAGYSFTFVKIDEGITVVDDAAAAHYASAGGVGMLRGPYHFFRTTSDPTVQVQRFLDRANVLGLWELPAVLDVEAQHEGNPFGGLSPRAFAISVRASVRELHQHTSGPAIVYVGWGLWDQLVAAAPDVCHEVSSGTVLWLAEYAEHARLPIGWDAWHFWQFTASGHVPGITGAADVNRFNGSLVELRRWCGLADTEPSPGVDPTEGGRLLEIAKGVDEGREGLA